MTSVELPARAGTDVAAPGSAPLRRLWMRLAFVLALFPAAWLPQTCFAQGQTPTLRHDLTISLDPQKGIMAVRDVIDIPAAAFVKDRVTLETADFITDLHPRLLSGGKRLSASSRQGPYGKLWDLDVRGLSRRRGVRIAVTYVLNKRKSAQLAIRPEGSLAGSSGDAWYPQLDFSSPEIGKLTIGVPAGEMVIAAGARVSTEAQEKAGTFVFQATSPLKFAFAAGRYTRHAAQDGSFSIYTLKNRANTDEWLGKTASLVKELAKMYGPSPYGVPALVEVDFPSIVLGVSEYGFILADDSQFTTYDMAYWGHEFSHQWWGTLVRARPGTPARTLLTEGLGEYSALAAIEALEGPRALTEIRTGRAPVTSSPLDRYAFVADQGDERALRGWMPGPQNEVLAMHRLSTSKGAWTLLMLGDIIGRDTVARGLRSLFPKSGAGAAAWTDVDKALSRAAAQDLEWFFQQWLGRTGVADLGLRWSPSKDGTQATGFVTQAWQTYRMPIEVDLIGSKDLVQTEKLWVEGAQTPFTFKAKFPIQRVVIDPRYKIFRRPLTSDLRKPAP